jgi:hypothetical protein
MQEVKIVAVQNWFWTLFKLASEEYLFIQLQLAITQKAVDYIGGSNKAQMNSCGYSKSLIPIPSRII